MAGHSLYNGVLLIIGAVFKGAFSNVFEVFIAGCDSFAYTEKTELLTVRSSEGGGI